MTGSVRQILSEKNILRKIKALTLQKIQMYVPGPFSLFSYFGTLALSGAIAKNNNL